MRAEARLWSGAVSRPRIGVVAAAGKGRRIHPRSPQLPKVMLEVAGKPLLTRNLELMRDALGVERVVVIIGHLGERIRETYGDGSRLGLALEYVDNRDVERGLGTALLAIERAVREPFVMLLGDELYLGTNHTALGALPDGYTAVCALYPTEDAEVIRKNYTVALDDGRITALIEKPERPTTPYVGCGTYLFTPEIYRDAHETPRSSRTGRLELTEIIDHAARRGPTVLPFVLAGHYVNVNTIEDLNGANFLCRTLDCAARRVSVVIPAYNEAVAKLIEALWWGSEPRFTDVGCTYRAIWRDAYRKSRDYLTCDDAAFSPEMMIEMLRVEGRVIEIPVSYYRRRGGVSKHSTSRWHSVRTGLRMLRVIGAKRLNLR